MFTAGPGPGRKIYRIVDKEFVMCIEVARYVYTLILKNLNTLNKNYFKFDVCRYENNIFKHRITLVIVLHLFIRLDGMVKDIIGNMVL